MRSNHDWSRRIHLHFNALGPAPIGELNVKPQRGCLFIARWAAPFSPAVFSGAQFDAGNFYRLIARR